MTLKYLALLLCIPEVPSSILGPEAGYTDHVISVVFLSPGA
jgi:hypothetical protein